MSTDSFRLETERLALRPLEERDISDLIAYLSEDDPYIQRVVRPAATPESVQEYWGKMRKISPYEDPNWYSMLVELKAEQKVVGNVGFGVIVIDDDHKLGSIGWSLSSRYRGRGLATEAARAVLDFVFRELKLHRVYARTGKDNVSSWRLMERLGMRREAHFRESHTNLQGEWSDEYIYAILRNEWMKRQSSTDCDKLGVSQKLGRCFHA